MVRGVQVSVIGYNADGCTEAAYDAAYRVGREVAGRGGVVVSGGLGGVMEAASKGAREGGGTALGIVPSADSAEVNEYCDMVVATGLGFARDLLVVYSGDGVIVVGGGAGTLIETSAAYLAGKPIVAVRGTGGVADEWAGRFIDERRRARVAGASSPEEAVRMVMDAVAGGGSNKKRRRVRKVG